MDCRIFKKRVQNYVLEDIPKDLKSSIEEHIEKCESCKSLYEEEIKIDRDFKKVLSVDGVKFNSSRTDIINSIDKKRYSKKTSNKILYSFKRHKYRYLACSVAAIAMFMFTPMMLKELTKGNHIVGTDMAMKKSVQTDISKEEVEKSAITNKESLLKEDKVDNSISSENQERMDLLLQFQGSIVLEDSLPSYKISWEASPDGKKTSAIDVGESRDIDFGIHVFYVKDMKTNKIMKYEIINNTMQFSPMNIEWWDNQHLIVVAGFAYGTIAHGSKVYCLDVNTGKISLLYSKKDEKHEILEINRVKDDLILKLKIYNDDSLNEFHTGVGKLTLLELDKIVDMKIESEEKK